MKMITEKKNQSDNDSVLGYLWAAYNLAKKELFSFNVLTVGMPKCHDNGYPGACG